MKKFYEMLNTTTKSTQQLNLKNVLYIVLNVYFWQEGTLTNVFVIVQHRVS